MPDRRGSNSDPIAIQKFWGELITSQKVQRWPLLQLQLQISFSNTQLILHDIIRVTTPPGGSHLQIPFKITQKAFCTDNSHTSFPYSQSFTLYTLPRTLLFLEKLLEFFHNNNVFSKLTDHAILLCFETYRLSLSLAVSLATWPLESPLSIFISLTITVCFLFVMTTHIFLQIYPLVVSVVSNVLCKNASVFNQ